jgi:ribosome-associated protein
MHPGIPPQLPLRFEALLASGPGGQHVNKTASAVRLYVDLNKPGCLPSYPLERLRQIAASRIDSEGVLRIECQEERSQLRNQQRCLEKLAELIELARHRPKDRKATKPTRGSQERRLESKKQQSKNKSQRRWKSDD